MRLLRNKIPYNFLKNGLIILWFLMPNLAVSQGLSVSKTQVPGSGTKPDLSLPLQLCFKKEISNLVSANSASDNESSLYFPFEIGKVAKINTAKNVVLWTSDLGGEIASDLLLEGGRIYLLTKVLDNEVPEINISYNKLSKYTIWSLNAETGITEWKKAVDLNAEPKLQTYQGNFFLTLADRSLEAFDFNDHSQTQTNKKIARNLNSQPYFFENKIYFGNDDNSITIISSDKLEFVSKIFRLKSPATILGALKNKLYWGDQKGFLNLYDTQNNKIVWSIRNGGAISSLNPVGDGILVSSLDNFVYKVSLQNGKIIWRRRLPGRISTSPLISDDYAVFNTATENNPLVLSLKDGKIVNRVPLSDFGFVLSKPFLLNKLLVFFTNRGIFSFSEADGKCTQN